MGERNPASAPESGARAFLRRRVPLTARPDGADRHCRLASVHGSPRELTVARVPLAWPLFEPRQSAVGGALGDKGRLRGLLSLIRLVTPEPQCGLSFFSPPSFSPLWGAIRGKRHGMVVGVQGDWRESIGGALSPRHARIARQLF